MVGSAPRALRLPPAAAMAAAVAAPIPRLAPVTTATRPASHISLTDHPPVEPLVGVQALFQVEMPRHGRGRPNEKSRPPSPTASAAALMSSGGTRKPVTPSAITSPRPPRLNATTGVPHACASAAAIPKGSAHLAGNRTTAARAMAAHSDARGTAS